ncbi:PHB depolymerase family esterase [Thiorhodococcus mannitoliphagus]|uniref:PHB depolymerase family esterase n=1 Tax=Thiorhodococcus mannitoliphagus TaxID=329406 RepID=A0A6P1DRP3_9GAMM|nr:PHB depolymerase family esterase [Thiorhodococcus mannitoliphagus]
MDDKIKAAMAEATRLTQAGRFAEATALIQGVLGAGAAEHWGATASASAQDAIEGDFELVDDSSARGTDGAVPQSFDAIPSEPGVRPGVSRGTFTDALGRRDYRLYRPRRLAERPALLVMLHGCGQDPEAFAQLTRMDDLAEDLGFVVLYPAQSAAANASGCWSWYSAENQDRGAGEPGILAAMTRHLRDAHRLDPRHVYVAGFSAGAAMAVTLAVTYPDLFAAVCAHSGLPYGVAGDLITALSLMAQGPTGGGVELPDLRPPPIIVFHGDGDPTVSPANAEALIQQFLPGLAAKEGVAVGRLDAVRRKGQTDNGLNYLQIQYKISGGDPLAELWLAQGAGHGWLGGRVSSPFAEPRGPDASREMLRFFWSVPCLAGASDER